MNDAVFTGIKTVLKAFAFWWRLFLVEGILIKINL